MIAPPSFVSNQDDTSQIGDIDFWRPFVAGILERHGLVDAEQGPLAGFNATYPTFVCGDVVVKLFGYTSAWRKAYEFERAALMLVATDPEIAAPRLLGEGQLSDDHDAPWPYLITSRISGVASSCAAMSTGQWSQLAAELGRQIRRVHTLQPSDVAGRADWQSPDVVRAAIESSLSPHLIAQIDQFLANLAPFDDVFVHGDLCANHVFVENGQLTGIVDWGDAMVTDRHYEIIQLYRDMFGCNKTLLRVFLEASHWPVDKNFARQALGMALHRQAIGLAQHRTMDVFEPIAARFPLNDIGTLDELAIVLFDV